MLNGSELVLQALGFLFSLGHQLRNPLRYIDLVRSPGGPGDFRHPVHFLLDASPQAINLDVRLVQNRRSQPSFLLQKGKQQVLDVNLLVPMLNGDGLGGPNRLLHFFGESIEVHEPSYWLDAKS